MGATNYKELDIWKRAIDLCEQVYKVTKDFPKDELYGLVVQMRRAAVSVGANIAEGFARRSNPDFKRFLTIARGSLLELETHIEIARRLEFITLEKCAGLSEETEIISKMITRFSQNMR